MSAIRENLGGRTEALEDLAVELYARGLSTRDIEDAFKDEHGRRLLSRAAVSEISERLWAEYEVFCKRDLILAVLFAAATGLRPGEWMALEQRDIDRQARVVYVRRALRARIGMKGPAS